MQPYIVTFYGSQNCGAYLQAYALGHVLQETTGNEAVYVDMGARSSRRSLFGDVTRLAKSKDAAGMRFVREKAKRHLKAQSLFRVEWLKQRYSHDDVLVFGSDEIWNVSRSEIAEYPALWGEGIEGGRRIAYAPSSNGADFDAFEGKGSLRYQLRGFYALSARDALTVEGVSRLTGRDVSLTCDPTFLLTKEDYEVLQRNAERKTYRYSNFMMVYSYRSSFSEQEKSEIKAYAREHGLSLVSTGAYLDWCDQSVPAGPFEFLELIDRADCVVTDTFHGTAFSILYGKHFASYARENRKVLDMLERMGLQTCNPGVSGHLAESLGFGANGDEVRKRLDAVRTSSLDYLENALASVGEAAAPEREDGLPWRAGERYERTPAGAGSPVEVREDVPLAPLTTVKIGGEAVRLFVPKKGDDLRCLPKHDGRYLVISGGSNLLINDNHRFDNVISMREYDDSIVDLGGGRYQIGASVRIQTLIKHINRDGFGGIEELVSLPAMVGGLIAMNASVLTAGVYTADFVESVTVFDGIDEVVVPGPDCGFGHRTSRFLDGRSIILGAIMAFPRQDPAVSAERVSARRERCRVQQDASGSNFGSIFSHYSRSIIRFARRMGVKRGHCALSRKTNNWLLSNGGNFSDALAVIEKIEQMHVRAGKSCVREVQVWE